MTNEKLDVAKLQLFFCDAIELRLCDMSSLLCIGMAGPNQYEVSQLGIVYCAS